SGLGSRRYLAKNSSIQSLYHSFSAQNSCCKRYISSGINVHAFSFKARLASYMDFQKQISRFSAAASRHSFSPQTNGLAILDSCRYAHLKRLGLSIAAVKPEYFFTSLD